MQWWKLEELGGTASFVRKQLRKRQKLACERRRGRRTRRWGVQATAWYLVEESTGRKGAGRAWQPWTRRGCDRGADAALCDEEKPSALLRALEVEATRPSEPSRLPGGGSGGADCVGTLCRWPRLCRGTPSIPYLPCCCPFKQACYKEEFVPSFRPGFDIYVRTAM